MLRHREGKTSRVSASVRQQTIERRTQELLKDNVSEFQFTLGPARLTGAVQAIINPIGIK